MNLYSRTNEQQINHTLLMTLARMLSPLCGLNPHINLVTREKYGPKLIIAGAELTGVHLLQGVQDKHKPGVHHIGGVGTSLNEVLIKVVGETLERYAQLTAFNTLSFESRFTSYQEMLRRGDSVLPLEKLTQFNAWQYDAMDFPFQRFDEYAPLTWIRAYSLTRQHGIWVPAQLLLVGYQLRVADGEPWLCAAVTTGTATHRTPHAALRNALLELTQIDAAMGHWYTKTVAQRIIFDSSLELLASYLDPIHGNVCPYPEFYHLQSVDLNHFNIACVLRNAHTPKVVVGLGADTQLISAMRKAYLEAAGVASLARLVLIDEQVTQQLHEASRILDLDTNVAYYANDPDNACFNANFNATHTVEARALIAMATRQSVNDNQLLINTYRASNKELIFLNLTTNEARQIGFSVARVWSPDTLSLCLPGAAPLKHARFNAYGGVCHDEPHPYP